MSPKPVLTKEIREALQATVRGTLEWNVPMKERTTIRVGGPADCVFAPADAEDVAAFVQFAKRFKVPYDVLGAGSNLIVRDGGYRGVLLDLSPSFGEIEKLSDTQMKAGAGLPLPTLVARGREWGMAGVEVVCGIPGQVGGAIAMNAGTSEGETQQLVESVTLVDKNGRIKSLPRDQIPFAYRTIGMDKGTVVLEAVFAFEKGDPKEIGKKVDASKSKRKATQPLDIPNAGCAFKNVVDPKSKRTKLHAGRVIEELNLKGVRLRGAQISDVHANFIVNVGNATAKDVLGLVQMVRDKVKEAHGVVLESEWRVIGEEAAPAAKDEDQ